MGMNIAERILPRRSGHERAAPGDAATVDVGTVILFDHNFIQQDWREVLAVTDPVRLAVRTGAPIIPVSIVGAEEAFPVIARLYRVGNLVGVPWIPVTPTFPLCGLAGALPLPTRWSMHFGEPIFAPPADGGQDEERRIAETTERVRTAIGTGLTDLLAKRRGIFV